MKTTARSPSYSVHGAKITSLAHLSRQAHPVTIRRGKQGDRVLQGGLEVDGRSKGRASGVPGSLLLVRYRQNTKSHA